MPKQTPDHALRLPAQLNTPVRFAVGDAWVTFALDGAAGSAAVSGNTVHYADALPGVDVAYSALNDGVDETLTLAGPTSPSTFTYTVATSAALSAKKSAEGGERWQLRLTGKGGKFRLVPLHPALNEVLHEQRARSPRSTAPASRSTHPHMHSGGRSRPPCTSTASAPG